MPPVPGRTHPLRVQRASRGEGRIHVRSRQRSLRLVPLQCDAVNEFWAAGCCLNGSAFTCEDGWVLRQAELVDIVRDGSASARVPKRWLLQRRGLDRRPSAGTRAAGPSVPRRIGPHHWRRSRERCDRVKGCPFGFCIVPDRAKGRAQPLTRSDDADVANGENYATRDCQFISSPPTGGRRDATRRPALPSLDGR